MNPKEVPPTNPSLTSEKYIGTGTSMSKPETTTLYSPCGHSSSSSRSSQRYFLSPWPAYPRRWQPPPLSSTSYLDRSAGHLLTSLWMVRSHEFQQTPQPLLHVRPPQSYVQLPSSSPLTSTSCWRSQQQFPHTVTHPAATQLGRSNKGASKQRRDQINAEIATMRDLLPLPESARQRLSQLQIMSLSCVYIRKCNVLQKLFRVNAPSKDVPVSCDFFQALTGFLLITTREGKLIYISENVTDYLGHSMVDMKTQGDSLYDIVDKRDHGTVQAQLLQGGAEPDIARDVAFFCRMNMSRTLKRQAGYGDVKVMHVRGHFITLSEPEADCDDQQQKKYVFMATCSPLITPELKENLVQSNTMVFKTVHQLDMTFLEVTKTAEYHLGYSSEEICQKSWYSMLHPEDIHEAREKHVLLIRSSHEMGCMMTVRMLSASGAPFWVNIVMHVQQATTAHSEDPLVVCINQVISEEEAYQIKIQSHIFSLYPSRSGDLWSAALPGSQTPSLSQPQNDSTTHWMPIATDGTSSSSASGGFQAPLTSYYVGDQQRSATAVCPVNYPNPTDNNSGYQLASSPPSAVSNHGQTENLKLMLKRKIQNPCRQAKVPKVSWQEDNSTNGDQSFQYSTAAESVLSPHSSSPFFGGSSDGTSGGFSWSHSTQVLPRSQYHLRNALPTVLHHQHKAKAALLSPPLSASGSYSLSEQVVPDSLVSVPDSYLTPDPSPSSSPEPCASGSLMKLESLQQNAARTSVSILQELEKLAALDRTATTAAIVSTTTNVTPSVDFAIKPVKMECSERRSSCRQKELPVMDAFDIESFFDNLLTPAEAQVLLKERCQARVMGDKNIHTEAGVKSAHSPLVKIKQEHLRPHNSESQPRPHFHSPGRQKQTVRQPVTSTKPQQQGEFHTFIPVTKQQQAEVDEAELDDLFDFFSGDITTTQLDLTESLLTPSQECDIRHCPKKNGEQPAGSLKEVTGSFKQESALCSAGHCSASLLQSACMSRPPEDFSPVSTSDFASDLCSDQDGISDLSSDEDSNSGDHGGDSLEFLLQPDLSSGYPYQSMKEEDRQGFGQAPVFNTRPARATHVPDLKDMPGLDEADELYQLHKLLTSILPSSGIFPLSEETQ